MRIPLFTEQQKAAFWARVRKGSPDACWLWKSGRSNGYGIVKCDSNDYGAHVIAFYLTHGVWPIGRVIMHTCDNPPCCNPNHLVDGSTADNNKDMLQKGRSSPNPRYGGEHHNSVLTEEDVLEIKRLGLFFGASAISKLPRFRDKISRRNIAYILNNQAWRHLL